MSTLIWKDLRHHASEWLWSLLVATVGGTIIGVVITSWWSAVQWSLTHPDGPYMLASNILGSNMVSYIGVATALVISTTLGLTVTAQQRSHTRPPYPFSHPVAGLRRRSGRWAAGRIVGPAHDPCVPVDMA